jgi:alpha-beta hydrolase superfamily lysophospholipase
MKKSRLKRIWKWTQIILLIYVIAGIALYYLQEKFVFHPTPLPATYKYSFDVPFRESELVVNEEKTISMVRFLVPDSAFKGIVLYFHGNRGNINRYAKYAVNFTSNGYETWMIDYPGYGKSTGVRSEANIYEDAASFYKMALSRVPAEKIILYGKSLGSGVAAQLAANRDCKRLILETPYYSMNAVASHYCFMYPVSLMSKFEFATYRHLEYIKAPITIFHGTGDQVIPYKNAKRLVKRKPNTELITIKKGAHNNLAEFPVFRQKLDSLLNQM